MSELYVEEIFPVSFRPGPFIVGRIVGDFTVGDHIELQKADGTTYRGVVESLDIHHPTANKHSFVFSDEVSTNVAVGDTIRSLPPQKTTTTG